MLKKTFLLIAFLLSTPFTFAQQMVEVEMPEPQPGALFGWDYTTFVTYQVAAVSSPGFDHDTLTDIGAVYLYSMNHSYPATLVIDTVLIPDLPSGSNFGRSISAGIAYSWGENVLAISSKKGHELLDDQGVVFIYTFDDDLMDWTQTQILTSPDSIKNETFGDEVIFQPFEYQLMISDPEADSSGAVYIFNLDSTGWNFTQKLKADDPETGARFGESLEADIASSNIYVGAPRSSGVETNTGAVYVFEFIDDAYTQTAKVIDSTGTNGDQLGYNLAAFRQVPIPTKQSSTHSKFTYYYPFFASAPFKEHDITTGSVFLITKNEEDNWVIDHEFSSTDSTYEHFGKSISFLEPPGLMVVENKKGERSGRIQLINALWFDIDSWEIWNGFYPVYEDSSDGDYFNNRLFAPSDYSSYMAITDPYKEVDGYEESGSFEFYINHVSANEVDETPLQIGLAQNYPNPFNPSTVIRYQIATHSNVELRVFDLLGREVAELVNDFRNAGNYQVSFDASHLASGVYLYRLTVGNEVLTKKMMLIK